MLELWKKRRSDHQKQMFKYLRYVLNDHFVLALLFILGGIALGYSNYLRTLPQEPLSYAKPLVLVILLICLQVGKLATLFKPADIVFIAPRQAQLGIYLEKALNASIVLPWVFDTLVMLVMTPFLLRTTDISFTNIIFIWLLVLVLKYLQLQRQVLGLYDERFNSLQWRLLLDVFFSGVLIGASLYLYPLYLLLVAAILAAYIKKMGKALMLHEIFDWQQAITNEGERMQLIYRFFSMFTDVSGIRVVAKRRRYLDRFLPKAKPNTTFKYLYWRALARNSEYSGLAIRLSLLGAIILYFVTTPWLAAFLAVLFIYLIGFQLLGLYSNFDENVFMHIYPIAEKEKQAAFQVVLCRLLAAIATLFVIINCFRTQELLFSCLLLAGLLLESWLLSGPYLKQRLAKRA